MLLMIDNYDSFTYNLVQYFGELGEEVRVVRNDQVEVDQIAAMGPDRIVISPGPCTPNQAGVSLAVIDRYKARYPMLGVCLGHQCLGQAFGGHVIHAHRIMHGKTSQIHHRDTGLFKGLEQAFTATRYHSLVVDRDTLPEALEVTAWTADEGGEPGEIMGIKHRDLPLYGVQFHPESILTTAGHRMLENFLTLTG